MTLKPNTDNGLQGRTTEHQLPTAVLQKWRCSASCDSEVVNQNLVLRLKFSGENRHLRKAAKRYQIFIKPNSMIEEFTLWSTIQTKSKCYVIKKY